MRDEKFSPFVFVSCLPFHLSPDVWPFWFVFIFMSTWVNQLTAAASKQVTMRWCWWWWWERRKEKVVQSIRNLLIFSVLLSSFHSINYLIFYIHFSFMRWWVNLLRDVKKWWIKKIVFLNFLFFVFKMSRKRRKLSNVRLNMEAPFPISLCFEIWSQFSFLKFFESHFSIYFFIELNGIEILLEEVICNILNKLCEKCQMSSLAWLLQTS